MCFYGARIAGELGGPACPTLLLFGGGDEYIPLADIEAVVAHHGETVVYPEAGHGFMRDGSGEVYDEEAASDGWEADARRPGATWARPLGKGGDL